MSLEDSLKRLKEAQTLMQKTQTEAENVLNSVLMNLDKMPLDNSGIQEVNRAKILVNNLVNSAKSGKDTSKQIEAINKEILKHGRKDNRKGI